MTFKDAVRTCLREKYASFEGRAPRSEYWNFWLFYVLATFGCNILDTVLFPSAGLGPLSSLFALAILIPFLTAAGRRLHDRDMSAWWLLLMLLPIIGSFILIVIYLLPGTPGPNRFGPDPLRNDGPSDWPDDEGTLTQSSIPRVNRE